MKRVLLIVAWMLGTTLLASAQPASIIPMSWMVCSERRSGKQRYFWRIRPPQLDGGDYVHAGQ